MDNLDPRYVRSRVKLRAAFLELAHDDPEKLSVSAVCERTKIDRATFYRHFDTMDDLVADALGDLAERGTAEWESLSTGSGTQFDESTAITVSYLDHINDNRALYRWALGPNGSIKTVHALLERSARGVAFELEKLDSAMDPVDRAFRAAFVSGGLLGACIQWVTTDGPTMTSLELARSILTYSAQPIVKVVVSDLDDERPAEEEIPQPVG